MMFLHSCTAIQEKKEDPGKECFVDELKRMYQLDYLTSHFPPSWDDMSMRTNKWMSRYCCSEDDSLYHSFSCLGLFVDDVKPSFIDSLYDFVEYEYKTMYYGSDFLKINFFYMKEKNSYNQENYDTTKSPIYDFRDASYYMGTKEDSILTSTQYGDFYLKCSKEILPSDFEIYIIDSRSGNFWRNQKLSEKEPRPVLPDKWKHGYSRGIGVSQSCNRVAWWVMAW